MAIKYPYEGAKVVMPGYESDDLYLTRSDFPDFWHVVRRSDGMKISLLQSYEVYQYLEPFVAEEPKYPSRIMEILRERKSLSRYDTSRDSELNMMSKNEVFAAVLEWEGIIGYDYTIRQWIKDIYGIDLV